MYSTYFFFEGANDKIANMILGEAKRRGCKITKRIYSKRGEATIITAKNWSGDVSMRAWKVVYDEHKNKNKLLNEKRHGKRKRQDIEI